ncbi:hypothetical protein Gotur_025978 [Gossypium turneri]
MHITLQKRDKGQTWSSPILGQGQLDPYSTDLGQKRLMLQRFQEELKAMFSCFLSEHMFRYRYGGMIIQMLKVVYADRRPCLEKLSFVFVLVIRFRFSLLSKTLVGCFPFQQADRVTKRLTGKPKSIAFPLSQFLERPIVIDSSARPRETETLELIRETPRSLSELQEDVIYKWEFDLFYIKVGSELKHFCINPGFDFSQAHFLGSCPDPRTFMGGIRAD